MTVINNRDKDFNSLFEQALFEEDFNPENVNNTDQIEKTGITILNTDSFNTVDNLDKKMVKNTKRKAEDGIPVENTLINNKKLKNREATRRWRQSKYGTLNDLTCLNSKLTKKIDELNSVIEILEQENKKISEERDEWKRMAQSLYEHKMPIPSINFNTVIPSQQTFNIRGNQNHLLFGGAPNGGNNTNLPPNVQKDYYPKNL